MTLLPVGARPFLQTHDAITQKRETSSETARLLNGFSDLVP